MVATSVTAYVPAALYITEGFCDADVEGDPPANVHAHEVGTPVDWSVKFTVFPAHIVVTLDVKLAVGATGPVAAVIVKLLSLMSKKIFPTASTLIRQVVIVVASLGTVITCVPSFGVLASRVVKVVPPSKESSIFTFAQFTGVVLVEFTFHVTVWVLLLPQVIPVTLGYVTVNGPEAATVIAVEA